jgi:hypothetical protein
MVMFMVGFIIGLLAVAAVIGGLSLIGAIAGAIYGFFKGLFGQPDIPAKQKTSCMGIRRYPSNRGLSGGMNFNGTTEGCATVPS